MSQELSINDDLLIQSELGDQYNGKVLMIDNDIVKIKFEEFEEDFLDRSINLMFNSTGRYNFKITMEEEGKYKFTINPSDILHNKPLATNLVWQYLDSEVYKCNCPTCIREQIRILESALLSVPPDDQMVNLLALHIQEYMLPILRRLQDRQSNAFRTILNLLGYNVNSDEQLNDLLNSTFNEQGDSRIKSSLKLIEEVKNNIKPYDSSFHKHKVCCLCLEDISKDENRLVISCPKCNQVFCAGNDDNKCGGFLKHMGEDHRCPCCRTKIIEWINEVESKKIEK